MRRHAAVIGSLGIHVACGLALTLARSDSKSSAPEPAHASLEPLQLVDLEVLSLDRGGGGSPKGAATPTAPQQLARASIHHERTRSRTISHTISHASSGSMSDALAALSASSVDGDGGEGGGEGGGRGGGRGRGLGKGIGFGDRASAGEPLPAVPAAPRASKARPAKLIYPTRERDASEGELYMAHVIIDAEGYVVGARLAQAHGPKDADAASMIFHFRYAPALDDDGHPIRSTLDQPFLVQ